MEEKSLTSIIKKLNSAKFNNDKISVSQPPFVGQAVVVFPKAGKITVYISLLTEDCFLVIARRPRSSSFVLLSENSEYAAKGALSAYKAHLEECKKLIQ